MIGTDSLPFEPPEQKNIRLRAENARLRRLLAVHSIPIPQLAPENPPPTKRVEMMTESRNGLSPEGVLHRLHDNKRFVQVFEV